MHEQYGKEIWRFIPIKFSSKAGCPWAMWIGNLEVYSNWMLALVDRKFKRPVLISFLGISIGSPSLAFKAKTVDMKDSDNEIDRYDLSQ